MTHNNRSTIMTYNDTDNCPSIEAETFKNQVSLGPNFLSLYGCFILIGDKSRMINPSGFLLQFIETVPQLNNKAEAAIYLYLISYKDKYNDILNSTETSDKKIKQLIILRETITRVLIHSIAYYALLCSDDNDMVIYDNFPSGSLQNYSPYEVHEKYKKYKNNEGEIRPGHNDKSISDNSNNIIDDIISQYFSGKTLENIIKEHIISLFIIENIEKLAAELFGISDDKKEVIRLEILEQNAYPTVLQSFMEIEDKFIGSDLSDKLLNLYTSADSDEKTHEVLKHFKFGLKKDLIGKSPAQVLFSDILYSITISPVRYIGLRELAKKMLSENNKSDNDLKPENVENLHNFLKENNNSDNDLKPENVENLHDFLKENNKSDNDLRLCEINRDLCLGSGDTAAPTGSSSCETERDLCLGSAIVEDAPDAPDASIINVKNPMHDDARDLKDKFDKKVTRIQEIHDIITKLSKTINKNTNSTDTISKITEVLRQTIALKERVETYYGDVIKETKISDIEKKIAHLNKSYNTIISLSISSEKMLIKIYKLYSNFILRELKGKGKNVTEITNNMNNSLENIVQEAFEIKGDTEDKLENIQNLTAQVEAMYNKHKALL